MAKPKFVFRDCVAEGGHPCRVATFEIPGGVTTPPEFASAVVEVADSLKGEFGLVLDGRGPVWGFGMILHVAHPTRWVATRDPRLGAVVVESHDPAFKAGDIINFPEE